MKGNSHKEAQKITKIFLFDFTASCFLCLFVASSLVAQQGDVVTYERLQDSDRERQNWMH